MGKLQGVAVIIDFLDIAIFLAFLHDTCVLCEYLVNGSLCALDF